MTTFYRLVTTDTSYGVGNSTTKLDNSRIAHSARVSRGAHFAGGCGTLRARRQRGQRLLARLRQSLGPRFIDDGMVDGEFATAPFLHAAGEVGWPVVARLKDNLPELFQAAQGRFGSQPPHLQFTEGADRVEPWEADDFDPWETLRWPTVRVIRHRQHKPGDVVVEACGLTNLPRHRISRRCGYAMAKSRS